MKVKYFSIIFSSSQQLRKVKSSLCNSIEKNVFCIYYWEAGRSTSEFPEAKYFAGLQVLKHAFLCYFFLSRWN